MPQVNSECMQIFLDEIARRSPNDNVVMGLDGAGWPKSADFRRPDNLRRLFLPPYAPDLNPQEYSTLKRHAMNLRRTCDVLLPRLLSGRVSLGEHAA